MVRLRQVYVNTNKHFPQSYIREILHRVWGNTPIWSLAEISKETHLSPFLDLACYPQTKSEASQNERF